MVKFQRALFGLALFFLSNSFLSADKIMTHGSLKEKAFSKHQSLINRHERSLFSLQQLLARLNRDIKLLDSQKKRKNNFNVRSELARKKKLILQSRRKINRLRAMINGIKGVQPLRPKLEGFAQSSLVEGFMLQQPVDFGWKKIIDDCRGEITLHQNSLNLMLSHLQKLRSQEKKPNDLESDFSFIRGDIQHKEKVIDILRGDISYRCKLLGLLFKLNSTFDRQALVGRKASSIKEIELARNKIQEEIRVVLDPSSGMIPMSYIMELSKKLKDQNDLLRAQREEFLFQLNSWLACE